MANKHTNKYSNKHTHSHKMLNYWVSNFGFYISSSSFICSRLSQMWVQLCLYPSFSPSSARFHLGCDFQEAASVFKVPSAMDRWQHTCCKHTLSFLLSLLSHALSALILLLTVQPSHTDLIHWYRCECPLPPSISHPSLPPPSSSFLIKAGVAWLPLSISSIYSTHTLFKLFFKLFFFSQQLQNRFPLAAYRHGTGVAAVVPLFYCCSSAPTSGGNDQSE